MNVVNTLILLIASLMLPLRVLAHPGHVHLPGQSETLLHTIGGWDQFGLPLLAVGVILLLFLRRPKN